MSSFRRRTAVQQLAGTRPSPYNAAPLISTGLTSLDDLLGGGLPLSTCLVIESDSPMTYAELVLRYWIAQGLECGHEVVVVASGLDGGPDAVVDALMEVDGGRPAAAAAAAAASGGVSRQDVQEDEDEEKQEEALKEQMKIAFRYEGLRQHQTTVESSSSSSTTAGTYCSVFDLTQTRKLSPTDRSLLHLIDVDDLCSSSTSPSPYEDLYTRIETLVHERGARISSDSSAPRRAMRIALSGFGGPSWGSATSPALFAFLHRLRHLLRQSHASCVVTFPAHLYASQSGPWSAAPPLSPLLTRLSHAADGVLRLSSFAGSPSLSATFPRHAGLISFPKLPTLPPGSLVPPGSKLSVLRGLGGGGEGRENLVGFRVKRRRFVVEVVSDDPVAAGTGEDEQKEKRRKRVEEANRKEREMADGKSGMDVLLGLPSRVTQIRIGGEEEEPNRELAPPVPSAGEVLRPAGAPEPVSFRPARRKGVRIGGVQFQSEDGQAEPSRTPPAKISVARMVHETPDLLDF